jgi:alpha-beta hydrolase superfamily lysophospholipase
MHRVSGYENQLSTQVGLLQSLSDLVKSGAYTPGIQKPAKLVVMGFSFGSYVTHAAIGTKPDMADAVVLTAIGLNITGVDSNGLVRSFVPRIASQQNGLRFGDLDNGYLTWVDEFAQVNT